MQTSQTTVSPKSPEDQVTPINRPGARPHIWSEPGEEPILDAARVPLKAFRDNRPAYHAYAMYFWLHYLRPLLLVAFWVGVVLYAWRHFFRQTDTPQDVTLLGLYAILVAIIFLLMLLAAPIRKMIRRSEDNDPGKGHSTSAEVAEFTNMPSRRLFAWRRSRLLVVQHDRAGNLRDGADMDDRMDAPKVGMKEKVA